LITATPPGRSAPNTAAVLARHRRDVLHEFLVLALRVVDQRHGSAATAIAASVAVSPGWFMPTSITAARLRVTQPQQRQG